MLCVIKLIGIRLVLQWTSSSLTLLFLLAWNIVCKHACFPLHFTGSCLCFLKEEQHKKEESFQSASLQYLILPVLAPKTNSLVQSTAVE